MNTIALVRLFLLAALWGGSYLFIRIAAPVLGVFFTISLQIILAAIALGLAVPKLCLLSKFACTAFAYLLYFQLISNIGATGAATVTFLIPIFSLLFGHMFLNEPVNSGLIFGMTTILLSVWLILNDS